MIAFQCRFLDLVLQALDIEIKGFNVILKFIIIKAKVVRTDSTCSGIHVCLDLPMHLMCFLDQKTIQYL